MPIRITAVALAAGLAMLLSPAAVARAAQLPPVPPGLPDDLDDLLPDADSARFKLTIGGSQLVRTDFVFNTFPAAACALQGTGFITERWEYQRGKDVTIIFRKVGRALLLQRAGRALGDAAMAAPGTLTRNAGGAVRTLFPDGSCPSFPLDDGDCGEALAVRSNLSLSWSKGKLHLAQSTTENQKVNPAIECGTTPIGDFDVFTTKFPFLYKQHAALSKDDLFGTKRSLRLRLQDNFLPPADAPPAYTRLDEILSGISHMTLTRVR